MNLLILLHGSKFKLKHRKGIGSLVEHRLHNTLVQVELLACTCVVLVYCNHTFACHLSPSFALAISTSFHILRIFSYFVKNGRKWWGDGHNKT